MVSILPFYHVFGMVGSIYATLHMGTNSIVLNKFTADNMLNTLRNFKPTILPVVPPLVHFLATGASVKTEDIASLRRVMCGGGSLPVAVANDFLGRYKGMEAPKLQEGWGMTELSPVGLSSRWENPVIGKCGMPVPSTEYKIADLETGVALGPGEEGELWVRGPQVMKGYFNNEKATRQTIDEDGWLKTGDIAFYDNEQHFQIVDRLKELIKVKGLQVAPAELENVLLTHPGINDAAVVGIPHPTSGEVPRAYVVLNDKSLTSKQIAEFVQNVVAPHKKLDGGVEFTDIIPKSPTGKILRKEIRKMAFSSLSETIHNV
jgi:acyl-CoA synthetase (AMP-forming)/AMP-acid ligase II